MVIIIYLLFLFQTFTDTFIHHGINNRLHLCQPLIDHPSDESFLVCQKSQIIHYQHPGLLLSFRYLHFGCKGTKKTVLPGEHFLPKNDFAPCKIFQNGDYNRKYRLLTSILGWCDAVNTFKASAKAICLIVAAKTGYP